jgi:hypothetical protein
MATNRTTEGIRYASFLAGIRAVVTVAQDSFMRFLPLRRAMHATNEMNPIIVNVSGFTGFRGSGEEPGMAALRAVVVTPIFTMAGVEPERSTGAPGPLHVACFGAPVQVMVTFKDPLAPAVSASCRL